MEAPPDRKEVQEFKFKQFCSLRVFPSSKRLSRKNALNLVSTSTKYGVIFVGTPTGVQCIPLSNVIELRDSRANSRGTIEGYKRRELNLGCLPTHVSVNSSGDLLGVVANTQDCPVLRVYFVVSMATENIEKLCEVRLSSTPGVQVLDLQWNPAVPTTIGAILSDGSALVSEISITGGNPTIYSAPAAAQATCLCWSPKGKQVVLGSKIGTLTQYKPDLKTVKSYPPPRGTQMEVVSVHWLSSFQFIAVYKDVTDPQARSNVMVVNVPKGAEQSFINYEDVCFGSDTLRHEHYFIHVASWNVLLISTGNGLEVSVLYHDNGSWVQWMQDEGARAELPQTENHDDVFTVGMALNTNVVKPIPVGDIETIPPMPFLLIMSEEGVLCLFHAINLWPNSPLICNAPQALSDKYFSVPEAGEPSAQGSTQTAAVPEKPAFSSLGGSGEGAQVPASKPSFFPPPPISNSFQFSPQTTVSSLTSSPFQTAVSQELQVPSFGSISSPMATPQSGLFDSNKSSLPSLQSTIPKLSVPQFGVAKGSGGIFGAPQTKTSEQSQAPASDAPAPISFGSGMQFPSSTITTNVATAIPKSTGKVQSTPQPTPSIVNVPPAQASVAPLSTKESMPIPSGPPPVDNTMILNEIYKEVQAMKILMTNFHLEMKSVVKLVNDKTSLPGIVEKLDDLERFDKDLRETTLSEQSEVKALRVNLLEMWGWLENIKARQRQSSSQSYLDAVESKDLDPFLKKLMKAIDQNAVFVGTKIKEATAHLNSLWEKQKEPGSAKNFDLPHMEAIYETMALNKNILIVQQAKINELEMRLNRTRNAPNRRARALNTSSPNWPSDKRSKQNAQLDVLADKLLQTRAASNDESNRSLKETSTRYISLTNSRKSLTVEKEAALWNWHRSHKVILTKAPRVAVPDNEVLNRSFATPVKSPNLIVETPKVPSSAPISRSLFVRDSQASGCTLGQDTSVISGSPLVSSTPLLAQKMPEKPQQNEASGQVCEDVTSGGTGESKMPAAVKPVPVFGFPCVDNSSKDSPASSAVQYKTDVTPESLPKSVSPVAPITEGTDLKEPQISKGTTDGSEAPKTTNIFGLKPSSTTSFSAFSNLFSNSAGDKDKSSNLSATTSASPAPGTFSFGSSFSALPGQSSLFSAAPTSKPLTQLLTSNTSASSLTSSTVTSVTPSVSTVTTATSSLAFGFAATTPTTASKWFSGSEIKTHGSSVSDTPTSATMSPFMPKPISSTGTSTNIFGGSSPGTATNIFGGSSPGTTASSQAPVFGSSSVSFSTVSQNQTNVASSTVSLTSTATTVTSSASSNLDASKVGSGSDSSNTVATQASSTVTTPSSAVVTTSASTPAVTSSVKAVTDKAPSISTFSFATGSWMPATTSATGSPSLFSSSQATLPSTAASVVPLQASSTPSSSESSTLQSFGSTTVTTVSATPLTTAVTTSSSLFSTVPKSTPLFSGSASTQPVFGSTGSSPQVSFGSINAPAPSFGTPTTSAAFGAANAASQPVFRNATTTSQSSFTSPSTSVQSVFGLATTTQPSFGTPATSGQPVFGSSAASPSVFSTPTTTSSSSPFGTPTTTTSSVFGAVNALAGTSFFGSPTTTASTFGSSPAPNIFGSTSSFASPSTTTSSIFGASICSPNVTTTPATTANIFGSPFGQKSETTFGGGFGSFTTSPGGFGSSGGSMFGSGSTFGQTTQQGSIFQSGSSPGLFGSPSSNTGTFSGAGQSVDQTGFGAFGRGQQAQPQQTRPFGASGGAVFGGQATFGGPAFGGSATFGGSPTKQFGAPAQPAAAASFGTPTQSSTFENLAGQNTVSFGNLAQNQQPAFSGGSSTSFGQQQPQQQQSAFPNSSSFGGSSFTSWR